MIASLLTILQWFSGGSHQYMRLAHCMQHDYFWISLTVSLDLTVAAGYIIIARHWWRNERSLPNIPAKHALASMRNIFVFCGLCGYLFIPIKMVWPAWRLYDGLLAVLAYYTWKYARNTKNLNVVYHELGRSNQLTADLENSREESRHKTLFLNALSHDLRTPLNALSLQCDLAQLGLEQNDPDMVRSALKDLRSSSRATTEMLERLLQCAKLDWSAEPNELTVFSLPDFLEHVAAQSRPAANAKRLSIDLDCPDDLKVKSDRLKLERILTNLISNAVKFTNRGGITVKVRSADQNCEIAVIDTGVGLSPEQQTALFEEFYQAHNTERDPKKGFGLGLAIARRLARQLGGDISVASGAGGGSRFSVALPSAVIVDVPLANAGVATLEEAPVGA